MSNTEYLTVPSFAESEFTVNKSRFIGYIFPVTTKEEADSKIAEIRSMHPQSRHTVYAYQVRNPEYSRYSDDGEPSGTAGMPVLDVIKKPGVTDTLIVVVRYFGGILLGTGGLVRAYSTAAKEALENAGIIKMGLCRCMSVTCDYSLYGKVNSFIPDNGGVIENSVFGENIGIDFYVPEDAADAFCARLTEATNGKIVPVKTGEKFSRISEGNI